MKFNHYLLVIILSLNSNYIFAGNKSGPPPNQDEINEYVSLRVEKIKELANSGVVTFQETLGRMYYFGELGIEQNYEKSFKWYEIAAFNDDPRSQHELGLMYSNGLGTKKDQTKATEWFLKSAESGWGGAYYVIANRYLKGIGVEKNCGKSLYWYKKHSESKWLSPEIALNKLANLYISGDCVTRNIQMAYKYHLIYNKVAPFKKTFVETNKLKKELNSEEISSAEEQAEQWIRTYASKNHSNK